MADKEADKEVLKTISDKKEAADAITKRRSMYAAGVGLIPFPVIDLAALLGIQVLMIRDIAKVYGMDTLFYGNKIKHFVHTLVGSLGVGGIMSSVKSIPFVGSIVGMVASPVTGAAATYAIGKVFTHHFDHGGTLLDFNPEHTRAHFKKEFDEQLKKSRSPREKKAVVAKKVSAKKSAPKSTSKTTAPSKEKGADDTSSDSKE